MATIKNVDDQPINFGDEANLLLDELISVSKDIGHMSSLNADTLIYVHGNSYFRNMCKIIPEINYTNAVNSSLQKAASYINMKGGTLRVC